MALAKAESDRTVEESNITRLETKVPTNTTLLTSASAKVQLDKANACRKNLREIHQRILHALSSDTPATSHNDKYSALDDRIDIIIERLVEIQQRHIDVAAAMAAAANRNSQASDPPRVQHKVKLPELKIPIFDGKYEEWPSFEDLFIATIHKNAAVSSAQKLQYLKGYTAGEAHNLIKSFITTNENYTEAWTLLQSRYKNTREIITSLIKKILFQQQCKNGTPTDLSLLINTTTECVRSLNVMGRPTDSWDDLLIVIMTEKLDPESRSEWAKTLTSANPATFKELTTFMESHIRALTARGTTAPSRPPPQFNYNNQGGRGTKAHHVQYQQHGAQPSCPLCKSSHFLYKCPKLHDSPQNQRYQLVQKTSACTNCLSHSHQLSNCTSTHTCKKCNQKHHTLLHRETRSAHHIGIEQQPPRACPPAPANAAAAAFSTPQVENPNGSVTRSHHVSRENTTQVLLKTAIVLIKDSFGNKQKCRALLDDGSESSFITEACAAALKLPRQSTDVEVTGLGSTAAAHANWLVSARLESAVYSAHVDIEALVLKKITGQLPRTSFVPSWDHLTNLPLADPTYHQPGKIDLLLGADVVAAIMRSGLRMGPPCSPTASHTIFGWVLSGRVATTQQQIVRSFHTSISLDELVQRLWREEQPPRATAFTPEERQCEQHFSSTVSRNSEGRYIVRIPFHNSPNQPHISKIGETRYLAETRLLALERRFKKYPDHHAAYIKFMKEYEELGHMVRIPSQKDLTAPLLKLRQKDQYAPAMTTSQKGLHDPMPTSSQQDRHSPVPVYIPHHFVLKEDSSTTKLRVVFDASMKSTNGISLNDCMMVGPTIQDTIFAILLRFRMNPIAIKGDIAKMYRQFHVHPDDQFYQRILWRENSSKPIEEFRLATVTYGTASAPYLATRCLQQLTKDEQARHPNAARVLCTDMYVDDLMSGAATDQLAIELVKELNLATASACLSMRKYSSNSIAVMNSIPEEFREETTSHTFDQDDYVKALGIVWKAKPDVFTFYTKCNPGATTKRNLLSEIAKVFDPLGWLSPITITAKILFQSSWKQNQDWDDKLDESQAQQYEAYQQQLHQLSSLSIPRYVPHSTCQLELIGFSDASEKAYAACIYLVHRPDPTTDVGATVQLLASRTKVAPLKQISLPRLELCAAQLLCELVESVTQALNQNYTIRCYTDSMIVLKWIASISRRWKTYVANRVSAIQEVVPPELWYHVAGTDNPADLPSRGIQVEELLHSKIWWNGPTWAPGHPIQTTSTPVNMDIVLAEERSKPVLVHHAALDMPFIVTYVEKFSSLNRLITTTVVLQQFIAHRQASRLSTVITSTAGTSTDTSVPRENSPTASLTPSAERSTTRTKFTPLFCPTNRRNALNAILLATQAVYYAEEITQLNKSKAVKASSKLASLDPFLDKNGILRVGGRLQKSHMSRAAAHPIIISKRSHLAELIVLETHRAHLHASLQLTIAAVRTKYWIIGERSYTRLLLRKCIVCRKATAATMQQQMGQLPAARVTDKPKVFLESGVDFAGPFNIKVSSQRNAAKDKFYFAIFVCMATKAIHLEFTSSLSTEAFIACFRRFTARRGPCTHLYSDCGTNFIGAERVLRKLLSQVEQQTQLKLSELGTTFHFNPPSAPNQGGLWEAGVKAVKHHLKRIVGDKTLTLEQFTTLLSQIEACLNSRPLIPLSTDPNDMETLTPGHFLIGAALTAVPDPDVTHLRQNRLDHWQIVQQFSQHFWQRWRSEYLTTLQQRTKWRRPQKNAAVGDMVLITAENTQPTQWRIGRIVSVHPGTDGLVRKALVRVVQNLQSNPVQYSEFFRPINKLAIILPNDEIE